jgi:hypothetical protein
MLKINILKPSSEETHIRKCSYRAKNARTLSNTTSARLPMYAVMKRARANSVKEEYYLSIAFTVTHA